MKDIDIEKTGLPCRTDCITAVLRALYHGEKLILGREICFNSALWNEPFSAAFDGIEFFVSDQQVSSSPTDMEYPAYIIKG